MSTPFVAVNELGTTAFGYHRPNNMASPDPVDHCWRLLVIELAHVLSPGPPKSFNEACEIINNKGRDPL